jgi:hypothetical protein
MKACFSFPVFSYGIKVMVIDDPWPVAGGQ